jgi:hypothetical protein
VTDSYPVLAEAAAPATALEDSQAGGGVLVVPSFLLAPGRYLTLLDVDPGALSSSSSIKNVALTACARVAEAGSSSECCSELQVSWQLELLPGADDKVGPGQGACSHDCLQRCDECAAW